MPDDTDVNCAKTADRDTVWVMDSGGPNEACSIWTHIPYAKRQLLGERTCPGMPDDTLPSVCRLVCAFEWAEGSTSSIVFARWRQCALVGGHIDATERIRLNRPSAAAMRPYVKLL